MGTRAEPTVVPVGDRLCLALHQAARAMTARYRPMLDALGLTYPQYLVMCVLWEVGASSVTGLGERLALDSSTLSPLLKRLQANGLVTRTRDERDERAVVVTPTAAGKRLRARAAHIPDAICDATGMSWAEQDALVADLRRIVERLHESLADE